MNTEVLVIGAGVVGLAIARALAAEQDVLVVDSAGAIGTGVSARNSEVVHAGLYYEPGSLKARTCAPGRRALYAFCAARGVPHQRIGKLVVATSSVGVGTRSEEVGATSSDTARKRSEEVGATSSDTARKRSEEVGATSADAVRKRSEEVGATSADAVLGSNVEAGATLAGLLARGRMNGVEGLRLLDRGQARALEPALDVEAALLSSETGIVDAHGFMRALRREAEDRGATVALRARVDRLEPGWTARVGAERVRARWVVNAAGLGAPRLVAHLVPDPPAPRLAKGSYFALRGSAPFRRLIYPLPEPGGLGVHLTLDLAGKARFGPDVEWVDTVDYTVDPARAAAFYPAIRRFWPGLPDDALLPDYAGVRPKISGTTDFRIDGPEAHGLPGLINLFGIESPGLTAALALADHVASLMG